MSRKSLTTMVALGAGVSAILAICIMGGAARLILELIGAVFFGWLTYLRRVLPNVRLDGEGIATMVVCLTLFTIGLHRMLRWGYAENQSTCAVGAESRRTWSLRWTFSLVILIVLMFVVGLAATGIVHQGGWLVASRHSLIELRSPSTDRWGSSESHLRSCGMGLYSLQMFHTPPEAGETRKTFSMSWMAKILPGTGFYLGGSVSHHLPWNDPENSAYYKGIVPYFLNPEIPITRTPEGYGMGHYAGNVHALGKPTAFHGAAAPNSSQLIAAGEVAEGFKAWGDPTNLRDPGLGVNKVAGGFGGPSGSGAYFLFMDGSVRYLKESTDVKILRQLSQP